MSITENSHIKIKSNKTVMTEFTNYQQPKVKSCRLTMNCTLRLSFTKTLKSETTLLKELCVDWKKRSLNFRWRKPFESLQLFFSLNPYIHNRKRVFFFFFLFS